MRQSVTDSQVPGGASDQPAAGLDTVAEPTGLDVTYPPSESPAQTGATERETAREVAAQHFARLMYAPVNTWSRYVFHENEPHPYGAPHSSRG